MYDWNKVSKHGAPVSSSMPQALAREIQEQEERANEAAKKQSLKRRAPDPPSKMSTLPTSHVATTVTHAVGGSVTHMVGDIRSPYYASLARTTSSDGTNSPKGCYCQLGSVFRALLFLSVILGVTGGLIYWIYMVHFLKVDGTFPNDQPETTKIISSVKTYQNREGLYNMTNYHIPHPPSEPNQISKYRYALNSSYN